MKENKRSYRMLLVEDDEDDFVYLRDMLDDFPFAEFEIDWRKNYDEGLAALVSGKYDFAVVDHFLPGESGLRLIETARERGVDTPCVVLTGSEDREIEVAATEAGADDFITKRALTAEALERTARFAVERQRSNVASIVEHERMRRLFESSPDPIFETDSDGVILAANQTGAKALGYDNPEELIGLRSRQFIKTEFIEPIVERMREFKENDNLPVVPFIESVTVRKDGSTFHAASNFQPVRDERGELKSVIIAVRDISEWKDLQRKLEASEKRYRELVETIPYGVFEINLEGVIVYSNKAHHEMHGYEPGELVGKSLQIFYPDEDEWKTQQAYMARMFADKPTPSIFYGNYHKKNGDRMEAEIAWNYRRDDDGNVIGVVSIVTDVGKRLAARRELHRQKERLDFLANNSPAVIYRISLPVCLLEGITENVKDLLGFTAAEFYDKPGLWLEKVHPEEFGDLQERFKNLAIPDSHELTYRFRTKSGEYRWIQDRFRTIRGDDGEPTEIIGAMTDAHDRVTAELALKESEKRMRELNATKDKFFSIIAHDLRAPFQGMMSLTEMARALPRTEGANEIRSIASKLKDEAKRANELLENLLAWAKVQTGKIEPAPRRVKIGDAADAAAKPLQQMASEKNVSFSIDADDIVAFVDLDMLAVVLRNLFSNATKHSPPGGVVSLRASATGGDVKIIVEDEGKGFDERDVHKLFRIDVNPNELRHRDPNGSGLGLILCREFIELNKGTIRAENRDEGGARIVMRLPAAK
ncbi:MAG: PAS domain S-box protein [Ignavibacteriales bacterium]|nr:PAS domain S-box protein [Ignavibacteriales bacterium]